MPKLLSAGRFEPSRLPDAALDREQPHPSFHRFCYRTEAPFSREALTRTARRDLPASVYRCKGIVFTDDAPGQPQALQVVGRRAQLFPIDGERRRRRRHSEIVAIGRCFDEQELQRLFSARHA